MSKRILLFAEPSTAAAALEKELRARGTEVESTNVVSRVRERVEADDVDEIVIDAHTVSTAEAVARRVRTLRPELEVVVVRSVASGDPVFSTGGDTSFHVRAERLATFLSGDGASSGSALAIESDRMIKVLEVLVGLFEVDDEYFGGFTSGVARLSGEIARDMGMDKLSLDEVVIAALLRDIGKVGVRREVLEGTEKLTSDEKAHMENHVEWGVRLLEHIDLSGKILPIIRHHHERYDGDGYPDGLKGREIPLGARIINAAESFSAMVSDRPHRPAKSRDRAISELMEGAGTQFDPEVVEVLSRILNADATSSLLGNRTRIVIVDQEPGYRRLLRARLLNEGFEVQVLDSLSDGWASSDADPPSLVLADMGTDHREFFQAFDAVQQNGDVAQLPIAVLSRMETREVKLEALRHGVEDFILKTDDLEEVTARVRNVLTREKRRRGERVDRRPEGVTGQLDNLSVQEIVRMLCVGKKTACIRITSDSEDSTLNVQDGRVVHASCAGLTGTDAFNRIVALDTGEFQILHGVLPEDITVEENPTDHMIDTARHVDDVLDSLDAAVEPQADPQPAAKTFVIRPQGSGTGQTQG